MVGVQSHTSADHAYGMLESSGSGPSTCRARNIASDFSALSGPMMKMENFKTHVASLKSQKWTHFIGITFHCSTLAKTRDTLDCVPETKQKQIIDTLTSIERQFFFMIIVATACAAFWMLFFALQFAMELSSFKEINWGRPTAVVKRKVDPCREKRTLFCPMLAF